MSSEDISSFSDDELRELMSIDEDDIEEMQQRIKDFCAENPSLRPEEDEEGQLLFYFYYAVQYVLFKYAEKDSTPHPTDSDEKLREKAYVAFLLECYDNFSGLCDTLSMCLYTKVEKEIAKRNAAHPLLDFLQQLTRHRELHSRRIKGNPAIKRTRQEIVSDEGNYRNLVTGEKYDKNSADKWLIINPLPSDRDLDELDPAEMTVEERMTYNVSVINGEIRVKPPYSVIVTNEWDKLLRLVHTMLHIEEYVHVYFCSPVTEKELSMIIRAPWHEAWKELLGEPYYALPIQKLGREKKTTPALVSRLAEFRDLLRTVLAIVKTD